MNKAFCLLLSLLLSYPILADTLAGKVVKITDGYTVHVLQDNHLKEKIRRAGIDAPERKQPHGNKAKQYLASLIGNKLVTVDFNKHATYKETNSQYQKNLILRTYLQNRLI